MTARPTGTLLGVDVGGTFTDFLIASEGGYRVHKALSTPDDPSRAVLEGVEQLGETPDLVLHGSTVATNAVLERRGARTALVATEGMRDLLVIGRQARPDIYDLEPQTPEPLVARELSFELSAKLRPDGSVEREAGPEEVARLVQQARDGGAEALAVSLLYAYANPRFEELFAELLEGETGDGLYLSISSQVSPEYREVERTATTVLNAYVGPLMSRYLQRLAAGLAERGTGPLRVLQSDGGAASAEGASRLPVATLLSGPAAGVNGAFALARRAGFDRILTFDMGGTSTDVALCDGALPLRAEVEIDGFRARTPVVDVHTVGAGGGSIARIDAGGALRVGPQSAGADPGPACYGTGRDFTVTDAQAVLGRLSGGLLGGAMSLDVRRSRRAAAGVVHAFEGDPQAAAQAVIDVATANMEHALRVVSVQRGFDPREFTLVAFGGAGPLHACALADALEMPAVLVPPMPGVLAALGAVRSDLTATRVRSVLLPLAAESAPALAQALTEAGEGALARLDVADAALSHALDLRYAGQSYELTIDLTEPAALEGGPDALEAELPRARAAFDELHEARYAHHDPDAPVEIVNVRVTARVPGADIDPLPEFGAEAAESSLAEVWFGGERLETRFVDRAGLAPGDRIEAPSIVTQLDSTTLVPPGWTATVDDRGNLLLERS